MPLIVAAALPLVASFLVITFGRPAKKIEHAEAVSWLLGCALAMIVIGVFGEIFVLATDFD